MGVNVFFIENTEVVATVKLKRSMVDTRMLCIVIGKLCYRKLPSQIVLFVVDKNSGVGLPDTVFFSLFDYWSMNRK